LEEKIKEKMPLKNKILKKKKQKKKIKLTIKKERRNTYKIRFTYKKLINYLILVRERERESCVWKLEKSFFFVLIYG
jgi:hypothetical protein